MRVLYLNPFSQEVSGPDESLRVLLSRLIPAGVDAHIVLPKDGPQVPRYQALGATVHFAPLAPLHEARSLPSLVRLPLRLRSSVGALIRLAKELAIDLVHTNMEVLLEGGMAARILGIPHVMHYRGNAVERRSLRYDALVPIWARLSDHVYCISHATARLFGARGHSRRVEVLYNPVDVEHFQNTLREEAVRSSMGADPKHRLIGLVGRIHPRKDVHTFIKAATLVAAAEPEVRFVIVGNAEAPVEVEYQAEMKRLAFESGLAEKLRFAGARRDIAAVMRALDVLVMTSRQEGFGRVVAEAMAARCPVVVSRDGALSELVNNGAYGLCAEPGRPPSFAREVLRLLRNHQFAADLAAGAERRALADFDVRSTATRVLERYRLLRRVRFARLRQIRGAVPERNEI